ncbi:MAG: F0F1 ATP synthase subunit B [Deltaproteobacteria bacterium]|nr:F0F1 ATP synthase subunit B [Deltaproteobacteria bacterium]
MHELISPTVNFAILVGVLVYFLRKPVKDMVATRQSTIKTLVEEAQAQKLEAQRRYREFGDKLRDFEAEAARTVERARQDGEALKAKIIADARVTADRIVKDAEALAQSNVQDFKDQVRRETIAKAVEMAEKIIRDKLSSDEQSRIVNEYVGKV